MNYAHTYHKTNKRINRSQYLDIFDHLIDVYYSAIKSINHGLCHLRTSIVHVIHYEQICSSTFNE